MCVPVKPLSPIASDLTADDWERIYAGDRQPRVRESCPNCGAPNTDLKPQCTYCGSNLKD